MEKTLVQGKKSQVKLEHYEKSRVGSVSLYKRERIMGYLGYGDTNFIFN